jgi:NAD(P)H-flavin reductase
MQGFINAAMLRDQLKLPPPSSCLCFMLCFEFSNTNTLKRCKTIKCMAPRLCSLRSGDDVQILMCGPPPMIKFACKPAFEELGYTDDMYLTF